MNIPFDEIMVPLSAALGLSLIVERILEFFKNLLQPMLGSQEGRKMPKPTAVDPKLEDLEKTLQRNQSAKETEQKAEATDRMQIKAQADQEKDPTKRKALLETLMEHEKDGEMDERCSHSIVLTTPATDPDDGTTLKAFILQLVGFAVGIFLAHYSGIGLFNSFLKVLKSPQILPPLDYLMTGLLIGAGSGPMHILMRFISERKIPAAEPEYAVKEQTTSQPKMLPFATAILPASHQLADEDWLDIPYDGGIDCDKLEKVHHRTKNPDLIVYHHTAMNSNSSFKDVVRVIQSRTDSHNNSWLTGYHCVVLADGSIHPFCRWDRFGNHAVGYNGSSLGIAFNGNFEPDPKVPFSNPTGRYGPIRPTEAQLKAGARVVTLWTKIYKITPVFKKSILAHRLISSKACPGSAFPEDEFMRWVDFYCNQWEKSEAIQERIAAFRQKSFLFLNQKSNLLA